MRRLTLALLAVVFLLHERGAWATPLQATPTTQPPGEAVSTSNQGFFGVARGGDEPDVSVTYQDLVASGGDGAPRAAVAVRARVCEVWAAPGGPGSMGTENRPLAPVAGGLVDGAWYYQTCSYSDTGELASSRYWQFVAGAPGFGPDLAALAASAYDRIPLPFPVPSTAPSLAVRPITGLDTWLWIDPAGWQPREATAELAGFSVSVTATPTQVVWDMGEGEGALECDGPGVAWQPEVADGDQSTDCAYKYRWNSHDRPGGVFPASVTVEWAVAWTASNGDTGVLAPARRTTTFDVAVKSLEAQICYRNLCPEDS